MSRAIRALPVALLVALAGPAAAQQAGDTLVLSLDDALAIAQGANPTVLRAENDLGLNGPETRSTWFGQVLPSVTLDLLSTGYRGNLQRQGFDNLGRPLENPEANWIYTSNTQQGLSLNWNITGLSFLNAQDRQSQSNTQRELALLGAQAALRTDALGSLLAMDSSLGSADRVAQAIWSDSSMPRFSAPWSMKFFSNTSANCR